MPSLDEIHNALGESLKGALSELVRLVKIPSSIGEIDLHSLLNELQPIARTAAQLDSKHTEYLLQLDFKISLLREHLISKYSHKTRGMESAPKILIQEYPVYKCLITPANTELRNRFLPLKSLLLIGIYADYVDTVIHFADRELFPYGDIENAANCIRKSADSNWKHFHLLLENVPDWPSISALEWKIDFARRVNKLPRRLPKFNFFGKYDFLFLLNDVLMYVSSPPTSQTARPSLPTPRTDTNNNDEEILDALISKPSREPQFNVITGREIKTKSALVTFSRQRSTSENDNEAYESEIISAFQ